MKQNHVQKTKLTALFFALLLCVPTFASCGGGDTPPAETTYQAAAETTPETEEETAYTADYLPDVTYDGYEYRIIEYEEYLLHQEEVTGSVIDDAIYQRNLLMDGDVAVSEADMFGFITSTDDYTDFTYYGSGQKLLDFTGGQPVINQNEQLFDMYMKSSAYLGKDYVVLDVFKLFGLATESQTKGVEIFTAGHALFAQTYISNLVRLGDMEDD